MARVVVAMSGGVDSSVAALLAQEAGHEVIGVTLRLSGHTTDRGCCSLGDVEDARSVAALLGIRHSVIDLRERFVATVVEPYLEAHRRGWTPNPCMACNRYVKVTELARIARRLGASRLVTGHYARVLPGPRPVLARGVDPHKDQSYVLADVAPEVLALVWLPLGSLAKGEVRERARSAGLPVWDKRDSQEVCFVPGGRAEFLAATIGLHDAVVEDNAGHTTGARLPYELVTVGQRLREPGRSRADVRYVLAKRSGTIVVGSREELLTERQPVDDLVVYEPAALGQPGWLQTSAHGAAVAGTLAATEVRFDEPARRVAPGQRVVLYDDEGRVLASARVVDDD
jgi:tRNA-specific 2-thiouridylase